MAKRPIFKPVFDKNYLFEEIEIEFEWHPGFSVSQKQKSIKSLHEQAKKKGYHHILEVSTKSNEDIGRKLSAFNLKIDTKDYGKISIESAYQGSKVFENKKQYSDIYKKSSIEAKKDERLKNSGKIIEFNFLGEKWGLEPKSAFYDWLYLKAIQQQDHLIEELSKYEAFSDIEFNPKKSFSCQARTCAILVSLKELKLFDDVMSSPSKFKEIIYKKEYVQSEMKFDD